MLFRSTVLEQYLAKMGFLRDDYIYKFRIVIGLHLDMQTRPLVYALYPVSVRQTGTLPPASFGFPSRWTPLPLANDSVGKRI